MQSFSLTSLLEDPDKKNSKNIKNYTVEQIHAAILSHETLTHAGNFLKVQAGAFKIHLGKFRKPDGRGLKYSFMKGLLVEDAKKMWGDDYTKPLFITSLSLSAFTLKEIHIEIRDSETLFDASCALGVSNKSLKKYFQQLLVHKNINVDYAILKNKSIDDAFKLWGKYYIYRSLKNIPFKEIHIAIIKSTIIEDAAKQLKVDPFKLIKKIAHLKPSTYETLKVLAVRDAYSFFGAAYNKPLQFEKIALSDLPIIEIHTEICRRQSPLEAASYLGTTIAKLQTHLSKFNYNDAPLTIELMLTITSEQISSIEESKNSTDASTESKIISISPIDTKPESSYTDAADETVESTITDIKPSATLITGLSISYSAQPDQDDAQTQEDNTSFMQMQRKMSDEGNSVSFAAPYLPDLPSFTRTISNVSIPELPLPPSISLQRDMSEISIPLTELKSGDTLLTGFEEELFSQNNQVASPPTPLLPEVNAMLVSPKSVSPSTFFGYGYEYANSLNSPSRLLPLGRTESTTSDAETKPMNFSPSF